jgi:hypothetical protein
LAALAARNGSLADHLPATIRCTLARENEYNRRCRLSIERNIMRLVYGSTLAFAVIVIAASSGIFAQAPSEASRAVAGGGVSVPGWTGMIDSSEAKAGLTLNSAKLALAGNIMMVTTGPAVTYWNPANKATGNYTVKATFTEPKYMNLNSHPHPYGIVIAGNDMGTPDQTDLYCAPYGNGTFIVRGFGPAPFQMNGRGASNDAVHKAAGVGQPVTQDVALSVKGARVECSINGTVVAGYDKSELVTPGKLKSTDGIYGLRFAHNTEVQVTGFVMTKN